MEAERKKRRYFGRTNYSDSGRAEQRRKINILIDKGLSDKEIRDILHVPEGTMGSWRSRGYIKPCNPTYGRDKSEDDSIQTTLIGDDPQDDTTEIPDTVETVEHMEDCDFEPTPYTLRKVTRTVVIEGAFVHYEDRGDASIFTVQGADQYGTTEQIKDRAEKLIEELKDLIDIMEEE